ncbi:inner membrane protein YhaH [Acidimicrobiaceae bacterium]|nr:inner membrane protein YhaH [Acidimicrobiaceae bacterium]
MNFQTAIRSGFQNYANFKGRASRSEYWWWALFTVILSVLLSSINGAVRDLGSLVTLLPTIAVAVRRMHDVDRVGWFTLVPIYNFILGVRQGDAGENRFGPPPPPKI